MESMNNQAHKIINGLVQDQWIDEILSEEFYGWLMAQTVLMRQIIEMKIEGYNNKEIARFTHKKHSQICNYVNKAKKYLLAYLNA